jgi:hypothetical protein
MSKNRGDYVAAQERFSRNTSVRASCDDVSALAPQSEIDRARDDSFEAERELEVINEKSTTV